MAKRSTRQGEGSQPASLEDQVRALQAQLAAKDVEMMGIELQCKATTELLRIALNRNDELSREVTRLQSMLEARDGESQRGTKRSFTDGRDDSSNTVNAPKRAVHQSLGDSPVDVENSRANVNEHIQPIVSLQSENGESLSPTAASCSLLTEATDPECVETSSSIIEETTPIWHFCDSDELGVSPVEFAIGEKIEVDGQIQATTMTEKGAFRWIAPATKPRLIVYERNQDKTKFKIFKVLSVDGLEEVVQVQQHDDVVAVEAKIRGRSVCTLIRNFSETVILNVPDFHGFAIRLSNDGFALQNARAIILFRYTSSSFDIEAIWSTSESNHVNYGSFSLSPNGRLHYLVGRRNSGEVYVFDVEHQGEPKKIARTGSGKFVEGVSSSDLAIICRNRLTTFKIDNEGNLCGERIIWLKSLQRGMLDFATVKWNGDWAIHWLTEDRLTWIHVTVANESIREMAFGSPVLSIDVPEGGGGIEVVFEDGNTRTLELSWIPKRDRL